MIRDDLRAAGALTFTPNNAAAFPFTVPILIGSPPATLKNLAGHGFFQPGEPCILKSVELLLPYQFGVGPVDATLQLEYFVTGDFLPAPIPELGFDSEIYVPCCGGPLDIYIAPPTIAQTWCFQIVSISVDVATIGAPSSFNGHSLAADFSIITNHTLPLTAT